jgi:hypothetical protein
MSDEKPRYKWPRYAVAAVIIFLVASVIWVVIDAYKIGRERDMSAPIQTR